MATPQLRNQSERCRRIRTSSLLLPLVLMPSMLLAGCRQAPPREEPVQPFIFRSLNLRQKDLLGQPLWELSSPEARYDLSRRVAQARDLQGVIYVKGKLLYRLKAASGTVINDGEVVQLEGPIRLQRLGPKPLLVKALRVRWYPNQERMEIDRRPELSQGDLRFRADLARFWVQQEKLELRGRPLLERAGTEKLRLTLQQADWYAGSGQLVGQGPVRGERRQPGSTGLQTLTAPALSGNSLQQVVVLQAPVQILDPARQGRLLASTTTIHLGDERISSPHPFQGWLQQSRLSGTGFNVLLPSHTLVVLQSCRLEQPGDSLSASRCSWNWQTSQVEASGGVTLQRRSYQQRTTAERLSGVARKDGLVVFSSPGGRVETRMTLPPARPRDPGQARRRAPVSL